MSLTPNQIARRLLELKELSCPIDTEIDSLTEQMRAVVAARGNTRLEEAVPGWGIVKVSAASFKKLKGVAPALDLEAWAALPAPMQAKLRKMGVVKDDQLWSQERKSSVQIVLDATVAAAAVLAA